MDDRIDDQIQSGIASFFTLALGTPLLFAVFALLLAPPFGGVAALLKGIVASIPIAIYGLWVFPSWFCVALAGAIGLVVWVPNGALGRWGFAFTFSGIAVIWSFLVSGFPAHGLLAVAAAVAALLAGYFKKHISSNAA